jgi:hypothetical protein
MNFRPPAIRPIEVFYYTCPILWQVLLPPQKIWLNFLDIPALLLYKKRFAFQDA